MAHQFLNKHLKKKIAGLLATICFILQIIVHRIYIYISMLTGEEARFVHCGLFGTMTPAEYMLQYNGFYICTGALQHSVLYLYMNCAADAVEFK